MVFHSTRRRSLALAASTAFATMLVTGSAGASGFLLKEQSAVDQGAAYAGSAARADDPSTLFYNPAGMTHLPGYQFNINASYIGPQTTLSSGSLSTNTRAGALPASGTVGTDATSSVLLPSFFATAQLAPDWWVGLALTSPFGLTTKYENTSVARYYALTSNLRTINMTPSVAWKMNDKFSIAAGLQIEEAEAHLSNALDFGTVGAAYGMPGFYPAHNDGLATLKGSDVAVGWQVGWLFEPWKGTQIGFDYRSAMFHKLSGTISFQNVPLALSQVPTFNGGSASAKLTTPDTLSLGLAQDVGPVTLLAQIDYMVWSRFKNLLVTWPTGSSLTQENWHDTTMISFGADWHVTDQWTLRAGTAVDQTPVDSTYRTPRIPDTNRYWLSVGATWTPIPNVSISAAYSYIFLDTSHVDLSDGGPASANYLRGNLTATYRGHIDVASLGATVRF